jgi:hypothetical protein
MNKLPIECIIDLIKYLSYPEFILFTRSSKYYNNIIKEILNNKIITNYNNYHNFSKLLNNITILRNTWSPYCTITNILEYTPDTWNQFIISINEDTHASIKYAIYYAYFILNNTATSARVRYGVTEWIAVIYPNGMIKQLQTSTGYITCNDNNCIFISIKYATSPHLIQYISNDINNTKDLIIEFQNSHSEIIQPPFNIDIHILKSILIKNRNYNKRGKINYIEDFIFWDRLL